MSPFKKYKAMILFGKCVSWCDEVSNLDYSMPAKLGTDTFYYMVLSNLNCWDLLQILESEYVHVDDAIELCYDLKNESEDDKDEEGIPDHTEE